MQIVLVHGDITRQAVDAIVNAANTGLWGGGGVDGAIHRAAGPALAAECRQLRERHGGCPVGTAVVTGPGRLGVRCIIHTVGPVWHGGDRDEPELLYSCYAESLLRAEERRVRSIAFPAISCGVYGYPIEKAVRVAFDAVQAHSAHSVEEVRFVLFLEPDYDVYRREEERRRVGSHQRG